MLAGLVKKNTKQSGIGQVEVRELNIEGLTREWAAGEKGVRTRSTPVKLSSAAMVSILMNWFSRTAEPTALSDS
ncbi:hypothetical protein EYF80_010224 [Liparis tanakae]|uniref:Uncharacterized protein n=1 Tax=Liparis tanakae TaxID=230148 RepID=A0A4Z2IQY2_9TELE|nr:hypothetical protein EYF80_010224 [Liparis tanakae]